MTTIKLKSHGKVDLPSFSVSGIAKQILPEITYTDGVEYGVVIMKGEEFSDADRTTKNIRARAKELGYQTPPAEVALLLREKLTDEEIEKMGLGWIVTMHEPIIDSDGYPNLLGANRFGGDRWLFANRGRPVDRWYRGNGFAFLVPQVASEPSSLEAAIKVVKDAGYKVIKEY